MVNLERKVIHFAWELRAENAHYTKLIAPVVSVSWRNSPCVYKAAASIVWLLEALQAKIQFARKDVIYWEPSIVIVKKLILLIDVLCEIYCTSSYAVCFHFSFCQYTEEKLGNAEKTELDAQFDNLQQRADRTKQWTERIISRTEAVLQPNPSKNDPSENDPSENRFKWMARPLL